MSPAGLTSGWPDSVPKLERRARTPANPPLQGPLGCTTLGRWHRLAVHRGFLAACCLGTLNNTTRQDTRTTGLGSRQLLWRLCTPRTSRKSRHERDLHSAASLFTRVWALAHRDSCPASTAQTTADRPDPRTCLAPPPRELAVPLLWLRHSSVDGAALPRADKRVRPVSLSLLPRNRSIAEMRTSKAQRQGDRD
eukprot:2989678-Alexandrium_andersonii.AAC.1